MKLRTLIVLLILGLIAIPLFAKHESLNWQTGKLVQIEQGTSGAGPGIIVSGMVVPTRSNSWVYVVETATTIYSFWSQSGHPRPLTLNGDTKFALAPKGLAFLLDENGKEFKAWVIKTVAKQPAQ